MDGDCGEVKVVDKETSKQAVEGTAAFRASRFTLYLWLLPRLLPIAFFALFYFYPLVSIFSVSGGEEILRALIDPGLWQVAAFTAWQAALSTIATLIVGLPGAYLLGRYRFRGQSLLRALTAVPFVMPTLVVAAGVNALIGERGWVNLALASLGLPAITIVGTMAAIVLAHVFYNATIVMRLVGDYWSHLDPRVAQAARTLGASPLQAFFRVTLPLLAPALLAASLLVFIFDFTSFGVILILGGPRFATLEVEIYRQTFAFFNLPAAAALSLIQLLCTLSLTILYTRLSARVTRAGSTRSSGFTQQPLITLRQKLGAAVIVITLGFLLLSPLLALTVRSVSRLEAERGQRGEIQTGFTLDYYRALFENERGAAFFQTPINAVGNSVRYALITVILSLALGLPTAWVMAAPQPLPASRFTFGVSRAGIKGWTLEPLLMLPLGTSAVTLGLGYLLAFGQWWASPWLIPMAHTLIAFPFVVRSLLPAWRGIRPQWRWAAATLGASPGEVWRRIDLALVGRAMMVAAAFSFAISLGEFGATALLNRPEFPTVPIAIYSFIGKPGALNFGRALALSVILMMTSATSILLIERVRLKGITEF